MKLGLLTAAFPDTPLSEVASWAADSGYSMLEVACWPRQSGPQRRYAGVSHLDVVDLAPNQATEIVEDLRSRGTEISALAYYPNPLHPDPAQRESVLAHLRALIAAAPLLGVPVVNTFVGGDQHKSQDENFADFRTVFPDLVSLASDNGVKLAIENCPMIFSGDEWPAGHNIAYNPHIWEQMFDVVDNPTLGLNLDPSHLIWQMIDTERVVRDFGERIYHVHAKDLQVDHEGLYRRGIMSAGIGWQVPRLPGLGDVDWRRFVSALYRSGYDYVLCVEHEDREFEGTDGLIKRGFEFARQTLAPLIV